MAEPPKYMFHYEAFFDGKRIATIRSPNFYADPMHCIRRGFENVTSMSDRTLGTVEYSAQASQSFHVHFWLKKLQTGHQLESMTYPLTVSRQDGKLVVRLQFPNLADHYLQHKELVWKKPFSSVHLCERSQ